MKICPVGAQLFHADKQSGKREDLVVASRNFANAPKKMKLGERWAVQLRLLCPKMVSIITVWSAAAPWGSVFITFCVSKGCAPQLSQDAPTRVQQEVFVDRPPSTCCG